MELAPANFDLPEKTPGAWEEKRDEVFDRLRFHASLDMIHLPPLQEHDGVCHIVGSAPSALDYTEKLRTARGEKDILCTLNGAHGFVLKEGIVPSIHVIFEIDVPDLRILGSQPHPDVVYYICSHCPKIVANSLIGHKRVLWHCFNEPQDYQSLIGELFPGEIMVGGGHATLFRTINIARILGYSRFELYGCDCSFEGESHPKGYPTPTKEDIIDIWGADAGGEKKKFKTIGSLAFLAQEFINFCIANEDGVSIRVHGNGLLRYVHESRFPGNYRKN
jgi:hypothetical protein